MRMIVRFGKRARLRFISHLDLQRFFQRALNRTGLPIAFSNGFNPHPVMAFGSALALGWTSEYEVIDVKLAEDVDALAAKEAMQAALPEDLPVLEVKMVGDRTPSMMPLVCAARYRIENSGVTQEMLDRFRQAETVMAVRKTKSGEKEVNIRPMAYEFALTEDGTLLAELSLTPENTLKPDLMVKALTGEIPEGMRIHRTSLLAKGERGRRIPLMEKL